jgi:hypothetical protein
MEVTVQLHTPTAFPPGKVTKKNHWIGGLVGLRVDVDMMPKRKFFLLLC